MFAAAVDVEVLKGGEIDGVFHFRRRRQLVVAAATTHVFSGEDCLTCLFKNSLHVFSMSLNSQLQVSLDLYTYSCINWIGEKDSIYSTSLY